MSVILCTFRMQMLLKTFHTKKCIRKNTNVVKEQYCNFYSVLINIPIMLSVSSKIEIQRSEKLLKMRMLNYFPV